MTKKRFSWEYSHYDSTGEIFDWSRHECLMTDYLQKYEIEEWCQELNKIVDENEQLKKLLECSRKEANDYCEELMEKDEFIRLYKRQRDELREENKQLKLELRYCRLRDTPKWRAKW